MTSETVASWLAQAHAAHQVYRDHLPRPGGRAGDRVGAAEALRAAYHARREAIALDPERNDPAWQDESSTHDHDALMTFYREQLG